MLGNLDLNVVGVVSRIFYGVKTFCAMKNIVFFEGTYDNQFALILVFARSLCRGEVSVYLKLHRVTIRVLAV